MIFSKKNKVVFIPVSELRPNPMQSRASFDGDSLAALTDSIKQYGILQPLCIAPKGKIPAIVNGQIIPAKKYCIIAGERRWRAAIDAGLSEVPCIINDCRTSDLSCIAFTENVFREDLTFFDIATALNDMLMMTGLSQTELAKKFSISQPSIANKLRLLRLTPDEREKILTAGLTERHARALIRVEDRKKRSKLLDKFIEYDMSASDAERAVAMILEPPAMSTENKAKKKQPAKRHGKMTDMGLFFNSIDNAIRIVRDFGVHVEREQRDCGDSIEIVLRIPKMPEKAAHSG